MSYRPKLHQHIASALLLIAGIVYLNSPDPIDMGKWIPLSVPIQLKAGEFRSPEFPSGLNDSYVLYVESERTMEFERLECLMGMAEPRHGKDCTDAPEMIDIDWSVLHDGGIVASGTSRKSSGGFYSGTVAREIGSFPARLGLRYSVLLHIKRDGGELNATNPRLLIQTHPGAWKDAVVGHAINSELRILGIGVFTTAGVLTLVLTPLIRCLHRRYKRHKEPLN